MRVAANQVRHSRTDVVGEGSAINLNPLSHLIKSAVAPEVAGDCDGKGLERILHGD